MLSLPPQAGVPHGRPPGFIFAMAWPWSAAGRANTSETIGGP